MCIGVAGTDRRQEEDWLMEELADRGHDAVFVEPSRVSYLYQDGGLTVRHGDADLTALDVLLMRRTRFDVPASRDLIAALGAAGVRTVERQDVFYNPLSKFYSLLSFVGTPIEGVDVPASAVVTEADDADALAANIGFPLIVKPVSGREGEGVHRVDGQDDLSAALADVDLPAVLQEYVDVQAEYRVLVVGDEALGAVAKEGGDGVTRNFAQGAEFAPADVPELMAPAVAVAQAMDIEVAGVDIVADADGRYYEIECNRCPQFTGFSEAHPDVDVPGRIVDYLETVGG